MKQRTQSHSLGFRSESDDINICITLEWTPNSWNFVSVNVHKSMSKNDWKFYQKKKKNSEPDEKCTVHPIKCTIYCRLVFMSPIHIDVYQ